MKNNDLSMIGSMPLPASWLQQLPAYQSDDARLVRASLSMLFAAFHGQPSGTIENRIESIAAAAQLSIDVVQENLPLLITGYRQTKTRLVFDPMAEMAARLHKQYAAELQALHDRAVLSLASPSLFDDAALDNEALNQVGGATAQKAQNLLDRKAKAPHTLPYEAQMTEPMKKHTLNQGFTESCCQDVWQRFCDYAHSSNRKYVDWNAAYRTWLNNAIRWNQITPPEQIDQKGLHPVKPISVAFARPYSGFNQDKKEQAKTISRQRLMQSSAFVVGESNR